MGPTRGNVTGSFYVFFVAWVPSCLRGIDISRNYEAEILKKNIENGPALTILQFSGFVDKIPPYGPHRRKCDRISHCFPCSLGTHLSNRHRHSMELRG